MEEYNNIEQMSAGSPETELQEIRNMYSADEEYMSITDGYGGFLTIICCG